ARVVRPFPINLPHEYFASAAAARPEHWNPDGYDAENIPEALYQHPVYTTHGRKAVPLGYYSDGVPFTKKDTFICIYMSNGLTQSRLRNYMEFSDEFGGLAIKEYCPLFNLRRGCRLLEKGQVHDTHNLDGLSFPVELFFFDALNHMGLNLLCPLMDII
ncbi:unnamed protein product, partial [Prorocentrum cordatum]